MNLFLFIIYHLDFVVSWCTCRCLCLLLAFFSVNKSISKEKTTHILQPAKMPRQLFITVHTHVYLLMEFERTEKWTDWPTLLLLQPHLLPPPFLSLSFARARTQMRLLIIVVAYFGMTHIDHQLISAYHPSIVRTPTTTFVELSILHQQYVSSTRNGC